MKQALRNKFGLLAKLLALVVVMAAVFVAAGCLQKASKSKEAQKVRAEQGEFPMTVKDDAGRSVEIKKAPERVVSLAPANTEILFAIGVGDKVVGVSTYCDYPPEAKKKEKVGDFANPNVEKIIAVKPDIVFAAAGVQGPVVKRLEDAGIKVFVVNPKSIQGILDAIESIGKATGSEEKASRVVAGLRKRVDAVKEKGAKLKLKPKVFYEVYSQPLMTAGGPTVVNDMIVTAGGINVAGNLDKDFPQYSLETLIQDDPEIYVASTGSMASPGDIGKRPGWERISAIKNGKVFVFDENIMNRYGPRLIDGLEKVAEAIQGK
ncbi:MAG: cobalamin-binding protein [Actinobacteria bacterium]|nr:cobalamin-binding protein [Actinomycetota bacterium]